MNARSLAARNAWLLVALLPAIALQCWRDPALLLSLAIAMAGTTAFEGLALAIRREPPAPFLLEGSAIVNAAIIVSWMPGLSSWQLVAAMFIAVCSRQAFGGLGRNLFHPAAVGVAFALLLAPDAAPPAGADPALALAWLGGGMLLLLLRVCRWQGPAFLMLGGCIGLLASPLWALAAFFVAGDPVTTPENARTRALAAFVAGLLAGIAGANGPAVLPFALLAMNAAAPALDHWRPARRKAASA